MCGGPNDDRRGKILCSAPLATTRRGRRGFGHTAAIRRLADHNDPLLRPLIEAAAEDERAIQLEELVTTHVRPVVEKIIRQQTDRSLDRADAEDVAAVVLLRVVRRLQSVPTDEAAAIERLADFTATLTYNAIYDVLRRRHPEHRRLRNRLRHALMRDPRLALWSTRAGMACGLARMRGDEPAPLTPPSPTRPMSDRDDPAGALVALLSAVGHAVSFEEVVRTFGAWWHVSDAPTRVDEQNVAATQLARAEHRQYLARLWQEILALSPRHRAALLLNLREEESGNAIALVVVLGIATIDEIAAALEMTPERLAALWNNLPLDDLSIATILGCTRQQVINLRRSARERLLRRLGQ